MLRTLFFLGGRTFQKHFGVYGFPGPQPKTIYTKNSTPEFGVYGFPEKTHNIIYTEQKHVFGENSEWGGRPP